jgi:3-phenylpropionate/cinnamic acid dioxygenase small subunit
LDLIYGRQDIKVTDKNRIKILCNYLGFKYAKDQSKYEGFMISKYHVNGDNVLTINLYDKTQSNKDHKISGLTVEEKKVTDNSLRLDITAHRIFLIQMINAAKDIARVYIKEGVNSKYFSLKMLQKFIDSQDNRAWACNMVMAMLLLSLRKDKNGKLIKSSFSAWLKHKILIDMMKLDLLLKFSGSIDTSCLTEAEKEVFINWKDEEYIEQERKSTLYRMEEKLGLSTKLPYRMLKAIVLLDSVQGLDDKDSDRYVELLSKKKKFNLTNKQAQELAELQNKSSNNIMQSRIEMAETFGISLMPPVSDKRKLFVS